MDKRVRETRKGILPVLVLALLSKRPMTAHEIVHELESNGIRMPIGTIYPMLKRLENEGLVISRRRLSEPRPQKEYVITDEGKKVLTEMSKLLRNIFEAIKKLLWESRG